MIGGTVNAALEAAVNLSVQGPGGQAREIEAVVDTGYGGFLTLPPVLVGELGLPFVTRGEATLADGSLTKFNPGPRARRAARPRVGSEAPGRAAPLMRARSASVVAACACAVLPRGAGQRRRYRPIRSAVLGNRFVMQLKRGTVTVTFDALHGPDHIRIGASGRMALGVEVHV